MGFRYTKTLGCSLLFEARTLGPEGLTGTLKCGAYTLFNFSIIHTAATYPNQSRYLKTSKYCIDLLKPYYYESMSLCYIINNISVVWQIHCSKQMQLYLDVMQKT